MSRCPFANFPNMIDPQTYADGMPYDVLREIRESGPIHWMDDSYQVVPYWLVTGRDEIDLISKDPQRFSSEAGTALADCAKAADIALYRSKISGRNKDTVWGEHLDGMVREGPDQKGSADGKQRPLAPAGRKIALP